MKLTSGAVECLSTPSQQNRLFWVVRLQIDQNVTTTNACKLIGFAATVELRSLRAICVGNKELPQLPQARGGMSGQGQQERMHATERQ